MSQPDTSPRAVRAMHRRATRNVTMQLVLLVPALPEETRAALAPVLAAAALRAIGLPVAQR